LQKILRKSIRIADLLFVCEEADRHYRMILDWLRDTHQSSIRQQLDQFFNESETVLVRTLEAPLKSLIVTVASG